MEAFKSISSLFFVNNFQLLESYFIVFLKLVVFLLTIYKNNQFIKINLFFRLFSILLKNNTKLINQARLDS